MRKLWAWFTSPEDPNDKAMNVLKRLGALLPILVVVVGAISWTVASVANNDATPNQHANPQSPTTAPTTTTPPTLADPDSSAAAPTTIPDRTTTTVVPLQVYLRDIEPVQSDGALVDGRPATANGTTYPFGISVVESFCRSTGYVEYDLSARFTRFDATIALRNDARSDVEAVVSIHVDGSRRYSMTFGLWMEDAVEIDDLAGAQRLRLEVTDLSVPYCAPPIVFGNAVLTR